MGPGGSGPPGERRLRRRPHLDPGRGGATRYEAQLHHADTAALDSDRRFAAAVTAPRAEVVPAADHLVLERLETAAIKGMGRIPYSSNATFLVELEAPDPLAPHRPLRAVYKPARGERPLWDFPHRTLHFREVATYLVDAVLGFRLVPPTGLREGPLGPGSVQRFVTVASRRPSVLGRGRLDHRLAVVAALDALVNNADRKSAHLLVDEYGNLVGIDHGLTFLPYPRQRTVLIDLGGSPIVDEAATAIRALHDDGDRLQRLRTLLACLLDPIEVEAFEARLRELAEHPYLPVLDPWDGRPFEWW